MPRLQPPPPPPNQQCCQKQTVRFSPTDLAFTQPHLHGTTDWFRSQERRSRVEGTNGILKSRLGMRSEAARVCGLTRVSLVLAAWCVAFNLTMADRETRLAATGTTPTRRRRRRRISRAERDDTAALAEPEPTPTTANADRPPTRPPSKPPRRAQLPAALRHLAT